MALNVLPGNYTRHEHKQKISFRISINFACVIQADDK